MPSPKTIWNTRYTDDQRREMLDVYLDTKHIASTTKWEDLPFGIRRAMLFKDEFLAQIAETD